ncbi:MAG: hypothetical protein ACOC7J_05455 [Armatimonadota bacterium]
MERCESGSRQLRGEGRSDAAGCLHGADRAGAWIVQFPVLVKSGGEYERIQQQRHCYRGA